LAHVSLRKCYGPEETSKNCPENALENGGLGSISEQILDTRADLVLGGGAKSFEQVTKAGKWSGRTLLDQAKEQGFTIVTNLGEMDALTKANQDKPVLGLFSGGNMPVRWMGPKASLHGNIDKEPVTCEPNPERTPAIPTLAAMTEKAIDLLKSNEKGFFLQVEGASIDKQDHAANPCGQIGETVDLDEAVQAALAFAKADGKTLVIVTADHAHSSQIIPNDTKAAGLTEALMTRDGSVMSVSYGNSEGDSQEHTGAQLRVAAFGPHAGNFAGLTDQTDMFYTIRDALKLGESQRADAN
jgi:alkaline phosphatase